MAVTRTSLITAYPSFANAPTTMVDEAIASAVLQVDEEVLGAQTDKAVLHLACHEIAIGPYGAKLRLATDDGETPWLLVWKRLAMAAGSSWRTLG